MLDGKTASLRKTYKAQVEASKQSTGLLNENTERVMTQLAKMYERRTKT